jgi:hypothetical protein
MKTYLIEIQRKSYSSYSVEAENEEDAQKQALDLAESQYGYNADYEASAIVEEV